MHYEFDVQMDEKTLLDFLMYHNYITSAGFVWLIVGVFAIVLAVISGDTTPVTYRVLYALFGALFIAYMPWDLRRKTKKQLKSNPYYEKPIHYVLDDRGVKSSQGDNEAALPWTEFRRVKLSRRNVLVYMKNRSACVFPKDVFGDDVTKAAAEMKEHIARAYSR